MSVSILVSHGCRPIAALIFILGKSCFASFTRQQTASLSSGPVPTLISHVPPMFSKSLIISCQRGKSFSSFKWQCESNI